MENIVRYQLEEDFMKTGSSRKDSLENIHNRLSGLAELKDLAGENTDLIQGSLGTRVTGLITDSRRVIPGSAFFAIPGEACKWK